MIAEIKQTPRLLRDFRIIKKQVLNNAREFVEPNNQTNISKAAQLRQFVASVNQDLSAAHNSDQKPPIVNTTEKVSLPVIDPSAQAVGQPNRVVPTKVLPCILDMPEIIVPPVEHTNGSVNGAHQTGVSHPTATTPPPDYIPTSPAGRISETEFMPRTVIPTSNPSSVGSAESESPSEPDLTRRLLTQPGPKTDAREHESLGRIITPTPERPILPGSPILTAEQTGALKQKLTDDEARRLRRELSSNKARGRDRFLRPWLIGGGVLGLLALGVGAIGLHSHNSSRTEAIASQPTPAAASTSNITEISTIKTTQTQETTTGTSVASTSIATTIQTEQTNNDTKLFGPIFTVSGSNGMEVLTVNPNATPLTDFGGQRAEIVFSNPDKLGKGNSSLKGLADGLIGQRLMQILGLKRDFDPARDASLLNTSTGRQLVKEYEEPLMTDILDQTTRHGDNPFSQNIDGTDVMINHYRQNCAPQVSDNCLSRINVPAALAMHNQQPRPFLPRFIGIFRPAFR